MQFDNEIFKQHRALRDMVRGHGQPLLKIRPDRPTFETVFSSDIPFRAWYVVDFHGWRRELAPLKLDYSLKGGRGFGRYFEAKFVTFEADEPCDLIGLAVLFDNPIGWVINPWPNGAECHLDPEFINKASTTYRCYFGTNWAEAYIHNRDFY